MRSLLFAPGGSPKMMQKALQSGADAIILDLEDSVAAEAKATARREVVQFLGQVERAGPSLYVRINPLDGKAAGDDLAAVMPAKPDGLLLPKPEGPADVAELARRVTALEPGDWQDRTRIIAIATETAAGTLSLAGASWRHPRLEGLLWGGEDLAAAIGATANRDAAGAYTSPFRLARSLCLLAARAAGVLSIDAVYTDFRDAEGLAREAAEARRDGFAAKAAIHPAQIAPINQAFSYSDTERDWARRVVAALDGGRLGAAQVDGQMVDRPHLLRAQQILKA